MPTDAMALYSSTIFMIEVTTIYSGIEDMSSLEKSQNLPFQQNRLVILSYFMKSSSFFNHFPYFIFLSCFIWITPVVPNWSMELPASILVLPTPSPLLPK